MYAWATETGKRSASVSPSRGMHRRGSFDRHRYKDDSRLSPIDSATSPSGDRIPRIQLLRSVSSQSTTTIATLPDRPDEPIAMLTLVSGPSPHRTSGASVTSTGSGGRHADRIPLWALAPGVGILHGSTWRGLGIHLTDFSAINLTQRQRIVRRASMTDVEQTERGARELSAGASGLRTSPMGMQSLMHALPTALPPALIEKTSRPATPASNIPLPNPASRTKGKGQSRSLEPKSDVKLLSPHSRRRSPSLARMAASTSASPRTGMHHQLVQTGLSRSCTDTRPEGLMGWKKGRKEVMEEVLEDLGAGTGAGPSRRPSACPPLPVTCHGPACPGPASPPCRLMRTLQD